MKRILPLAATLLLLATFGVAADEWIQGSSLKLIAFSNDSRFIAFETGTSVEGIGNAVPNRWIIIADTDNLVTQKIQISEFFVVEGPEVEKKTARNKELYEKGYALLHNGDYTFEVERQALPDGLIVDYTDKQSGPKSYNYHLKFFIRDPETDVSLHVAECMADQSESKPNEEKEIGFFGPGWTTITDESYATPDGKNFVVIYRTPFMGEYDMGKRGAFMISSRKLSNFYNSVGFAHYKRERYDAALDKFETSYFYNDSNPKACYNIACMNALSGNAELVNEYLGRLKKLDTKEAAALLKQVATDSDFDTVRHLIK